MAYEYWTKTPGIGGMLRENKDFVVKEIINPKFLAKYSRTDRGIKPVSGPYTLFLLEKNGLNTMDALKIIANELNVREADIGYAGLKDKNAITFQYVTIKGVDKELNKDNLKLTKVGYSKNMISIGDLICNKFEITLHDCKNMKNLEKIISEIKNKGLPNYFGPQRFGIGDNNQEIGRMVLKRKFEETLKLINKNYNKNYDDIKKVPKRLLKFFIHAYQSFLFNKVLARYVKNRKMIAEIPVTGYNTPIKNMILKNILKKEGLDARDFRINELMITCNGASREAFIKVPDITYKITGKDVCSRFTLPKGSYATVLLREIVKK